MNYSLHQGMPMEQLASQMPSSAACDPSYANDEAQPPQQWLPQQPQPPSYEVSQARHGAAAAEPNRNRNRSEKAAPSKGPRTSKPPSKKPKVRKTVATDKIASKKRK